MKRIVLGVAFLLASCANQPAQPAQAGPVPPPGSAEPAAAAPAQAAAAVDQDTPPPAAATATGDSAPAPAAATPAGAGSGLTKVELEAANKIVMDAYPAPFAGTFKKVVAKIGAPQQGSDKENMFKWFGKDGDKCVAFFMTKDAKQGHAASGMMDAEPADCANAAKK
jgi:hypothetical protein